MEKDSSHLTMMSNMNNDGDGNDNNTSKNKRSNHTLSDKQTQKRQIRNQLMYFYIVAIFVLVYENLAFRHDKKNSDNVFNTTDENETNIKQVDNNNNDEDENAMNIEYLNMMKSNNNMSKTKKEIIITLKSIKNKAPTDNTNEFRSHEK